MSLRVAARREHPGFPWLEAGEPRAVAAWLRARGWLAPGDDVLRCAPAGEGNMNLVLRVETSSRCVVVKQSRLWVEKYDGIAAPFDRALFEQRFYARAAALPAVAAGMPRLLAADPEARALLLEDLAPARDFTWLYARDGAALAPRVLDALARWLCAARGCTRGEPDPAFANREMRALQAEHVFHVPYANPPALDLDAIESGLAAVQRELAADARHRAAVAATEARYLADGPCLVHGDFFPGSWLEVADGVRVIDPEFGFFGDPELDLGVAVAHLALAGRPAASACGFVEAYAAADGAGAIDRSRLARYAGAEVARRLLGVAQLALRTAAGERAALVRRAREALIAGDAALLFAA